MGDLSALEIAGAAIAWILTAAGSAYGALRAFGQSDRQLKIDERAEQREGRQALLESEVLLGESVNERAQQWLDRLSETLEERDATIADLRQRGEADRLELRYLQDLTAWFTRRENHFAATGKVEGFTEPRPEREN